MLPQKGGSEFTLWSLCVGAALAAGMKMTELPDVGAIFSHVTKAVGAPSYGNLRPLPGHEPHMIPKQALLTFWPTVKAILSHNRPFGDNGPVLPGLDAKYWPAVIATVAQSFITMSKDAMAPSLALVILMESAILMSKIDQASVPQVPASSNKSS